MPDIIYRFSSDADTTLPADAAEARVRLLEGNRRLVRAFEASEDVTVLSAPVGAGADGRPLVQRPFAAVLACADARAPVELIFCCGSNDLFVVRVAGNVPGDECLGSLEFATAKMAESLQLTVVLGHTGCGAVTAAVDSYLDATLYPKSAKLRAVVDRILPAVRAADVALQEEHGGPSPKDAKGRAALVETAVVLNVALSAMTVRDDLDAPVEYGVFDLGSRGVSLAPPPVDLAAFVKLAGETARSDAIRRILTG
jgi:carbonic anhydrase